MVRLYGIDSYHIFRIIKELKSNYTILRVRISEVNANIQFLLELVWKLSKNTKHKFPCWVELVLCELKKMEVSYRMNTHISSVYIVGVYL